MNRHLGLTLFTSALIVAVLAAQDEPPRAQPEKPAEKKLNPKKKAEDIPLIKELEKREGTAGPASGEEIQKIIERLNKNMDSSEERLNKKDPGQETRKIQNDIIKDLDELIKQQSQGGGGGGGGGASSSSASKGSKGGSSGTSGTASSTANGGGKNKSGGQANKGSQGGDNKKGDPSSANKGQKKDNPDKLAKGDDKDKAKGTETAKGAPGKEGKGDNGMGGNLNAKDKKDKNTISDLFKDVWGHLPLSKRQEMDAYAKERFLPKYDEILRQYYRTISEQGRRKDSE